ncbi:hypothetical protein TNCV_3162371 [Trichonephila clavipes]|nr:hypothetical protein TNCV_3162371 [Trichonephila clavipes]
MTNLGLKTFKVVPCYYHHTLPTMWEALNTISLSIFRTMCESSRSFVAPYRLTHVLDEEFLPSVLLYLTTDDVVNPVFIVSNALEKMVIIHSGMAADWAGFVSSHAKPVETIDLFQVLMLELMTIWTQIKQTPSIMMSKNSYCVRYCECSEIVAGEGYRFRTKRYKIDNNGSIILRLADCMGQGIIPFGVKILPAEDDETAVHIMTDPPPCIAAEGYNRDHMHVKLACVHSVVVKGVKDDSSIHITAFHLSIDQFL